MNHQLKPEEPWRPGTIIRAGERPWGAVFLGVDDYSAPSILVHPVRRVSAVQRGLLCNVSVVVIVLWLLSVIGICLWAFVIPLGGRISSEWSYPWFAFSGIALISLLMGMWGFNNFKFVRIEMHREPVPEEDRIRELAAALDSGYSKERHQKLYDAVKSLSVARFEEVARQIAEEAEEEKRREAERAEREDWV